MITRIRRQLKILCKRIIQIKTPIYIPTLKSELLTGRIALITGGTSGIGFSIAEAFLNSNVQLVIISGRNDQRVKSACKDLIGKNPDENATRVRGIVMDISSIDSIQKSFSQVLDMEDVGKIDILVNNAGMSNFPKFGKVTEKEYNDVLDTNLKGTYFLSQIVSNYMKTMKISGNILNIASSASNRPAVSPYMISKWGVRGLTLGMAKTLIPFGIVVNGIAPGPTATPMLMSEKQTGIQHDSNPSGRHATPEEIGNFAVFMVSNMGRMVVGDIVYMSGGAGIFTYDDIQY